MTTTPFSRLLFCALLVMAASVSATAQKKLRPAARPAPPNVLLITLDTIRADRLGCYGSSVATPNIDSLARDGILFENAVSQVPLTWPSHAAILTGTYPFHNGVQDFTGQPLDASFRTLAQALQQNGYSTAAVVSSFVLDRSWGLARGFEHYDDAFEGSAFLERDLALVERRADQSVDHALAWLKTRPAKPFFFWLHLFDPHSPYDPPEPFRSLYRDRPYDGEVAFADRELGRLLDWMKRQGLYNRTLIILVGDHGEALGDHGEKEHGFFLYGATTRVPLIVKPPDGKPVPSRKILRAVETVAVGPTILELTQSRDAIQQQFQSPGLFHEADEESAAYSETFYPFSSFGWSPLRSLRTERFHFIEAPEPELYDLRSDPGEKQNVAHRQNAMAAVLRERLKELSQRYAPARQPQAGPSLDPETVEKLRALGYVASRSPVTAEQLAAGLSDPKSKLWEFNAILEAGDASQAGNFSRTRELLRAVQEKDPRMYLVPFMLGQVAAKEGQWKESAAQLERALQLNPHFDQAMTALARALHLDGRTDEARPWLEKALELNPQNFRAWYELGWMESRAHPEAARVALEKALAIQPNFALAHRDLGMLQFQQRDYAGAVAHLEKAALLGLKEAPLHNFLGIAHSQSGRQQSAVESYRRALAIDPNLAEAHLNLAFSLQKLKRVREALSEYREACRLQQSFCQYVPSSSP